MQPSITQPVPVPVKLTNLIASALLVKLQFSINIYPVVPPEIPFLKAKASVIDAIDETVKACVENAITKSFKLSKYSKTPRWKLVKNEEVDLFSYDFKTEVDKQSILSVADKLKKELK